MKRIINIASLLLMSAVMLISCDKTGGEDISMDARFVISVDKNIIQSNGTDRVVFTATADGVDVTAETKFFFSDTMMPLDGNVFSTDKNGQYSIMATYGTFYTNEPVVVTAIDTPIPAPAEDPAPSKMSFVHRAFLNQYTGTGCGYCPAMVHILRQVFADEQLKDKSVLAAVHSYNENDPAYIANPKVGSYPYLQIDMAYGFDTTKDVNTLKELISERTASPAVVGISANPAISGNMIIVTVEVKVAQDGEYALGTWLLQDDIFGRQKNETSVVYDDLDYHNNCLRVADSKYSNLFIGHSLGELKAGQKVQKTFLFSVESWWKVNDMTKMHFASFVTSIKRTQKGSLASAEVVNVVDCPTDKPTPFQYN